MFYELFPLRMPLFLGWLVSPLLAGCSVLNAQTQSGRTVILAPEAARTWHVRELRHTPKYFRLAAWKDGRTLFGLAGCNPVELRVDAAKYVAWNVKACGDAVLAPDRTRAAWGDGLGRIRVGQRQGVQRLIFDPAVRDRGVEGDPSGLILWSPDGRRILTSWAVEWNASYTVVDVATGRRKPLVTQLDGYFLTAAWGWIDSTRILFTVHAVRDHAGRSRYSESGGARTDLALYNLQDNSYKKVTAMPDGTYVRPLARWSSREILVGEVLPNKRGVNRFWIYDTNNWSRRALSLPLQATDMQVADSANLLIIDRDPTAPAGGRTRLMHWQRGVVRPLAEVRGEWTGIAWSVDARRLAITTTVDKPASGMPGSYVTHYIAYVLEPRR